MKFLATVFVLILIAFNTNAQNCDFYLQKARQRLAEGDCEGAQRSYNVYKDLSNNKSATLEAAIDDCRKNQVVVKPQTRVIPQGYVDLGLPSGTVWKSYNESGFFSYQEAVNRFGDMLPTRDQFEELIENCTWVWNGSGYKVIGPNGNYIVLPASGDRVKNRGKVKDVGSVGSYWSSISSCNSADDAAILAISATYHFTLCHLKRHGFSVRLVWEL